MTAVGIRLESGSFGTVHANSSDPTRICKVSTLFYPHATKAEARNAYCKREELLSITNLRELVFYCTYQHPAMVAFHGCDFKLPTSAKMYMHLERGGFTLDRLHSKVDMRALLHDGHLRRICLQAGTLLRALHEANHVHGDLKPSNVLYDPKTQQLRVIDWGAVLFCPELRDPSELECTFLFESPESLGERERISPAHDMWSWGLTMLVLLNGGEMPRWKLDTPAGHRRASDPDGRWVRTSLCAEWKRLADEQHASGAMNCLPVQALITNAEAKRYLHTKHGEGALLMQMLQGLLTFDPSRRSSADVMLRHPWLQCDTPTWPDKLPVLGRVPDDRVSLAYLQYECAHIQGPRTDTVQTVWSIIESRSTWRAFVLGIHLWDRYRCLTNYPPKQHLWWALLCHQLAAGVLLNYTLSSETTLHKHCSELYDRNTVSSAFAHIICALQGRLYEPTFDHDIIASVRPHADAVVVETNQAVPWRLHIVPATFQHVLTCANYYHMSNAERVIAYCQQHQVQTCSQD